MSRFFSSFYNIITSSITFPEILGHLKQEFILKTQPGVCMTLNILLNLFGTFLCGVKYIFISKSSFLFIISTVYSTAKVGLLRQMVHQHPDFLLIMETKQRYSKTL